MKISIFIPTKNAGNKFDDTLKAIFTQNEKDFEVIIIDSGSTDNTLSIASNYPTKIYKIKSTEFTHGKTRNLSTKYANGDYIVFLSQDAVPENSNWLKNIIRPFSNKKIAGVFSRQIPHKESSINEKFFYYSHFPSKNYLNTSEQNLTLKDIFFSNASSAIRREMLEQYPFDEEIIMSEDQEWSSRMLTLGFYTAYESSSIVVHSHNYNFFQTLKRYFDGAYSLKQILEGSFFYFGFTYIVMESLYVFTHAPHMLPKSILNNVAKIAGTSLALIARYLPYKFNAKVSMHSYYWERKIERLAS